MEAVPIATGITHSALYEALQGIMSTAVLEQVAPTITVAVYHHDEPIFWCGWGWIDPDKRQYPVRPNTIFDLASVTKLFTTTALLSWVAAGKLDVYTPIVEIIPEFAAYSPRPIDGGQDPHSKQNLPPDPAYANMTIDPAKVTCWHLLTHTSGLPAWRDVYNVAPPPTRPYDRDPLTPTVRWSLALERLCNVPFVAPPNTGVRYSDIGLMLLGEIVARVHGTDLATAIRERVSDSVMFRPIERGVPQTRIAPTEYDANWRGRRTWGEVHDENAAGVGGVAGHAGLFGDAVAVAALGNDWLHHAAERFGIPATLANNAIRTQAESGAERRGLGWMLKSEQNSSAGDLFNASSYGHTGFTGTSLWVDPSRSLVVALLSNRVYYGREREGIHELRRAVHHAIAETLT